MRRYLTKRNIIVLAVLVLMFGWFSINQAKKAAEEKKSVREVTVTRGELVSSLTASGEIVAGKQASLNFPLSGKLGYIGVKEGDKVVRGKLLASMDLGDLQAAQTKAYYAYLAADANAKYVEDQVKNHESDENFLQKTTRVTAQTSRDAAYDTWLTAQRAVKNAQLYSPFAGIVANITSTAVGDTVGISDGVTVIDPTSLYFSAEVDESDVGKVIEGQSVKVELDAYNEQLFEGIVEEIGFVSRLSSTGATVYLIKVRMDESILPKLRLGMNGDAQIILQVKRNVLKVPAEAVVDGQVTINGGGERKVKVETGLEGDTETEVVSGLNEGDKVIIK